MELGSAHQDALAAIDTIDVANGASSYLQTVTSTFVLLEQLLQRGRAFLQQQDIMTQWAQAEPTTITIASGLDSQLPLMSLSSQVSD